MLIQFTLLVIAMTNFSGANFDVFGFYRDDVISITGSLGVLARLPIDYALYPACMNEPIAHSSLAIILGSACFDSIEYCSYQFQSQIFPLIGDKL
jgi:hypothetical protein